MRTAVSTTLTGMIMLAVTCAVSATTLAAQTTDSWQQYANPADAGFSAQH